MFIKRQTSGTMSDNKWQRAVATSGRTSETNGNEWYNKWKWVTKNNNECQQIIRVQNGYSLFYKEIQNFTVVPKRSFVFLQRNEKFWKLYSDGHLFFYNKTQNFETCYQAVIHNFTTKYRILKVVPKRPLVFPTRKYEIWSISFFS